MSYPYHGQYADEYSEPNTPRDTMLPQWEVLEQEQQSQVQAQQQELMGPHSPLTPLQTTPLYAQHLQLPAEQDAPTMVPSQGSPIDDSFRLQTINLSQAPHDESRGRQAAPRSRGQNRHNPYSRPLQAESGPSSNTRLRQRQEQEKEQSTLRFFQQLPPPPSTAPARRAEVKETTPPPSTLSSKFLAIRVDWRYDPPSRKITAHFEMPGIRREDIRVKLTRSYFNQTKQVTVFATRHAPFPGAVTTTEAVPGKEFYFVEGKYGECRRSVMVAPDTKPEDIDAQLDDGVLVLKINCGAPDEQNEVLSIPVR